MLSTISSCLPGSSPRVRSRHPGFEHRHPRSGIISACAEQTDASGEPVDPPTDHLRVCGADTTQLGSIENPEGSSPRVRSRHDHG